MKIYETQSAPNPRRVRVFLAEKGIDIEYVQLDIVKGENISAEIRAKYSPGKVPFLELDDGTCIGETVAICRYFEELHPSPPLMGRSALEKAHIEMWQRQVEFNLLMNVGLCFQHSTGYFKDRMTPVPEFGREAGKNAGKYLLVLEKRLAKSEYLCGADFSIVDITALCAIDFARVVKIRLDEQHPNLRRWYAQINQRPSAKV